MARPTIFQWNIKAKHVSDNCPIGDIKVARNWHRDAITIGKTDSAKIFLTQVENEEVDAEKEKLKLKAKWTA